MKAIVFGGSGFVGSHVVDALAQAGHAVTVFDLKPSAHLPARQKMIVGDMLDERAVRRAVAGHDVVYNIAGLADIGAAQDRPMDTIRLNVLANGVALEAARLCRAKRYVFASTMYVYSAAGSFYRASKQACEAYIESYQERYGLDYTILRFGSLYGPRADDRNGIHRLVREALETGKITYWGSPDDLREYIHVHDAARCSVDILKPEFRNNCVLITGLHALRSRDLFVMLGEMLGKKLKVALKASADAKGLHYTVTPYSFAPKEGKKLVQTHYTDMGQGLLSVMNEIYSRRKKGAGRP